MGMKGGIGYKGLRCKRLSLTLTALICTTTLLWQWEKTPLFTVLSPQNQLEILSPVVVDGVQTLDHETDNEEDVKIKAVEKETKAEQGERKTEEHLNEPKVETRNDEAKNFGAVPMRFETARSPEKRDDGCNYAKGQWVADSRRPLYSGFDCKQGLSGPWSCRLTQCTDFSYEGFRWQPENCEMPDFDGSTFMKRMQHMTVAFVGDSLGRQQFQSLMCMVTGGKDCPEVEDVGSEYGLVRAAGAKQPDGCVYRFPTTNTTILYYWSASLCYLEPLNINDPATDFAMHLDRPPAFLQRFLHRFNVLVLNTWHHWNRGKLNANRWVMYVGGEPIRDRKLAQIGNAKNFVVYSVIKWLNSQLPHPPQLKAFFRTISPRHFSNGDWNTGGRCDNTTPLAGGHKVSQDESDNSVVAGAVKGTGVKLLDITALPQLREEGRISRYSLEALDGVEDCLHWCLPGIPDTWNEILYAQL